MRGTLRLCATDLDGTLLRSDGSISARTRAALRALEQRGVTIMLVTGRPPRRLLPIAEAVGLSGIAICSNGAVIYDLAAGSVQRQLRLSAAVCRRLIQGLRGALPGVRFAVEVGTDYGREPAYGIQPEHPDDRGDPRMRRDDALLLSADGVTKLIVHHADHALADLLRVTREHAGALAVATHSGGNFVEVAAAGVTKAFALELYCAQRGIRAAEVIAFGDMPNDLPMLSWAGHAVAVANAHADVLAEADEVTQSNDDDGVAVVLERLANHETAGG